MKRHPSSRSLQAIVGRARRRGFTLPELLVAMVAGLIVALAVVGLSKEANNTFQEETRVAAAEMQLRTAIDRLRSDLQRASFMSTANIIADPLVAHQTGGANNASIPAGMTALRGLQGVRLFAGGSVAATPLSTLNGLAPDSIRLAGNFTTVEQLTVLRIDAAANPCGGQRLYLDINSSPSLWRMLGMTDAGNTAGTYDSALELAFQPIRGLANPDGGAAVNAQFIVRVTDNTGFSQFVATCASTQAASWNNGAPFVDLDPTTPLKTNAQLGGGSGAMGGISGDCNGGKCTLNPVQIVEWSIGPAVINPTNDPAKYDLTRQYIDVSGAAVGPRELVAEYAIDLEFAFTVDSNATGDITGVTAKQTVFPFDSTATPNSATYAADITTPSGKVQMPGPQRIRSVRVRLASRGASPDRTIGLSAGANYTYRYCVAVNADGGTGTCTAGSTSWARARTLITEVSLPNQAKYYWP